MRVYRWNAMPTVRRKWILWSVAALVVLIAGTFDRDLWGLGAFGLMIWAFTGN